MKDFLSNLALRVLSPEATLQPRLRTRFEAPSLTFEPMGSQPEDLTHVDELTHEITSTPSTQSRGETGGKVRASRRKPNFPKRLKIIGRDRSDRSEGEDDTNAMHATIRSINSSPARQGEYRSDREESLVNVQSGNTARSGESQKRSDVKEGANRSIARLRNSLDEPKSKPVIPHRSPTERALVPRSSLETPRGLPEAQSGMTSAGTIHISIGRVEVRAMLPRPTSPHRVAPKPERSASMSLDDYLSRRAHGGKR